MKQIEKKLQDHFGDLKDLQKKDVIFKIDFQA